MNATLSDSLKKLRLSGLAKCLDVRLQEATANRLTHAGPTYRSVPLGIDPAR